MSFFVRKEAPIVLGTEDALKCPEVYRWTSEVLPTPVWDVRWVKVSPIEVSKESRILGSKERKEDDVLTLCSEDDDLDVKPVCHCR